MVKIPNPIRSFSSKTVKQLLYHSGFTVRQVRKLKADYIIVFHSVVHGESTSFETILQFLSKNFNIVSLDELLDRVHGSRPMHQRSVVTLTFDDGLLNHAEVVYPILKRLRIPATFYVCSDLIDSSGSIWTYEIRSHLARLSEADRRRIFELAGVSGNVQSIVDWMKTIPVSRREQLEKEIRSHVPVSQFTPFEYNHFALMNWQQLQDLDPGLITIGSHTATHIDLPQADPERLDQELSRPKRVLESRLNRKVEHFCYPNGSFDERVLPFVRKYYSSAVTSRPGVVKSGDNPLLLNRVHVDFDLARFSWDLAANASRDCRH